MRKTLPKILRYTLTALVAVVLLYFAFKGVDWKSFASDLAGTAWSMVLLSVLAALGAIVFRALRWRLLLLPLDPDISRSRAFDASNIGNLANFALPSIGEFVRCGVVSSGKAGYDKCLGSILVERVWDTISLFLIIVAVLVFKWAAFGAFFTDKVWTPFIRRFSMNLWIVLVLGVLLLAVAVFLVFRFRGGSRLCSAVAGFFKGLYQGAVSSLGMKHRWRFLIYTVLVWLMYSMTSFFICKAVPSMSALSYVDTLFLMAVGSVASIVPVPGGALGAFHYLVALAASTVFMLPWETGILYATLSHESHAILVLILGAVSYAHVSVAPHAKDN